MTDEYDEIYKPLRYCIDEPLTESELRRLRDMCQNAPYIEYKPTKPTITRTRKSKLASIFLSIILVHLWIILGAIEAVINVAKGKRTPFGMLD